MGKNPSKYPFGKGAEGRVPVIDIGSISIDEITSYEEGDSDIWRAMFK